MLSRKRRLEAALLWSRIEGMTGVGLCIAILSGIVIVLLLTFPRDLRRFDPWRSAHSSDPSVYCRSYGEGGTVCSEVPEGVRKFRERHQPRQLSGIEKAEP